MILHLFNKRAQQALLQDLPHGTTIKTEHDDTGKLTSLECAYKNVQKRASIHFTFAFHGSDAVYLAGYISDNLQGQQISKNINRHFLQLCADTKVNKIHIHAEDMGIYAWARLGFVPNADSWKDIKKRVNDRLSSIEETPCDDSPAIPASRFAALRAVLRDDNPRAYWQIVDANDACYGTTLGKALTLPGRKLRGLHDHQRALVAFIDTTAWGGSLDMHDADCIARYKTSLSLKTPVFTAQKQALKR